MNQQTRLEIIELHSYGLKPREIIPKLTFKEDITVHTIRAMIAYYKKRAQTRKCFYTNDDAQFPSVLDGKIIYVCSKIRCREIKAYKDKLEKEATLIRRSLGLNHP